MLRHALKHAAVLAAAAITALVAAPTAHAETGQHYVALGDSYAAGAGVPNQSWSAGLCLRSDHNYGSLVSAALHSASYTDVTCSAAKINAMTSPQYDVFIKVNDPQLDAVTSDTDLVTLGIGGNDLGTSTIGIGDVIATCIAGAVINPFGSPCHDHYAHGYWNWHDWAWEYGDDTLVDRINAAAPQLASVLQQIHAKAPGAKVLLVGYPSVLPDDESTTEHHRPCVLAHRLLRSREHPEAAAARYAK